MEGGERGEIPFIYSNDWLNHILKVIKNNNGSTHKTIKNTIDRCTGSVLIIRISTLYAAMRSVVMYVKGVSPMCMNE